MAKDNCEKISAVRVQRGFVADVVVANLRRPSYNNGGGNE